MNRSTRWLVTVVVVGGLLLWVWATRYVPIAAERVATTRYAADHPAPRVTGVVRTTRAGDCAAVELRTADAAVHPVVAVVRSGSSWAYRGPTGRAFEDPRWTERCTGPTTR